MRPNDSSETDYEKMRHQPAFLIKYWPILGALAWTISTTFAFYYNTIAIADEVKILSKQMPQFVTHETLNLKLNLVDQKIESTDKKVDQNELRTSNQFIEVKDKLDQVLGILLNNRVGSGG